MHDLWVFFDWPNGTVLSNLLASPLWAVPAGLWARYHTRLVHSRHDELTRRLSVLSQQIEKGQLHGTTPPTTTALSS